MNGKDAFRIYRSNSTLRQWLVFSVNHLPPRCRSSSFFSTSLPPCWPRRTPRIWTHTLDGETACRLVQASPASFQRQDTSVRCCSALQGNTRAFKIMSQSSVAWQHILRTEELSMQCWMTAMTLVRFCACATNHLTELYPITSLLGEEKDLGKEKQEKLIIWCGRKFFGFFFFFFRYLHHDYEKGWKLNGKHLRTRLGQVCYCCFSLL